MKTADFDYELPPERIAQEPVEPRDSSRLLVLDRRSGQRVHKLFRELPDLLQPNDLLVVNRSRVIPARLFGSKRPGGGRVELLLLERLDDRSWKALVGGKGLKPGSVIEIGENVFVATIIEDLGGPQRLVAFDRPIDEDLDSYGTMPLPPYIHTPLAKPERYQTVYAREPGSAAAPTAGLHFTPALMEAIRAKGVRFAEVTLHVGLDTFAPVNEEDPREHQIHTEWCQLTAEVAALVNETRAAERRVIAVGTTSVRVLETAGRGGGGKVIPFEGRTDLFIMPSYKFAAVDAMITNFHLPRSTLLMLVSAFGGRDVILDTYREAIANGYRFYSFGDAMLIF